MIYRIQLSSNAEKILRKLPPKIHDQILEKLAYFDSQKNPLKFAVKLKGRENKYRFRIGRYRAIFTKKPNGKIVILLILKIAHRKQIYD